MDLLLTKRKDKRGVIRIIFFFIILFAILIIGFIAVIVVSSLQVASDTITLVMEGLGMVGDTNLSEASSYTFGVGNTLINSMPWLLAFGYGLALIFSIVLVVSYNYNPNPAFIGVYIALILLLIVGSIIISNSYEDIYSGTDDIALKLQDNTAMSYMILYSPFILTLIAFVTGIFLFGINKSDSGGQV
jgi:hypothetical protein